MGSRRNRVVVELEGRTPDELADVIAELLRVAQLSPDDCVQVLGSALVTEAVRPYWESGHGADESHALLRRDDPELADAVEELAPLLLGRAQAQEDARDALAEIEGWLLSRKS